MSVQVHALRASKSRLGWLAEAAACLDVAKEAGRRVLPM